MEIPLFAKKSGIMANQRPKNTTMFGRCHVCVSDVAVLQLNRFANQAVFFTQNITGATVVMC